MTLSKTLLASSLYLIAGTALATSYSSEINFGFSKIDREGDSTSAERIALYGEHHLKPVEVHQYPFEEAAFLAKSTYVYGGFDVMNPSEEDTQWAGIAYYVPNSVFYVEGAVKRFHDELGEKGNDFGVVGGMRLFDGMLLTTRYWDEEGYEPNAHIKMVHQLAGGNFINVEVGYTDTEIDSTFEAAFDAYFDPSFSVGLLYKDNMGEDEITLRTMKYVTNVFHIGASVNKMEEDKSLAMEAGIRF